MSECGPQMVCGGVSEVGSMKGWTIISTAEVLALAAPATSCPNGPTTSDEQAA